jgi:radical SAM protein (TIGR01212 family)
MTSKTINKNDYIWGHERRFNAYSNYLRKSFGERIQKVSIDAGFTCPNRDGTKGTGGCTYCNNDAFNPSYCIPEKPIWQQIDEGIKFHQKRYRKATRYLAYFQAYSNTYASLEKMKRLYEEALSQPGIIGLIIGTRPDCIDYSKLDYIKELSEKYYVVVEYGIESCYNKTLQRINRGHSVEDAWEALKATSSMGINTGAHFIFGLPGESVEEMLAEAEIISGMPLKSVKFHQLQIIKGTRMEDEFRKKPLDFHIFSWEEYLDFFISFLERLNPSIVVERFTGEAPPRLLYAANWGKKRTDQIVTLVEKRLEELDTWQGKKYHKKLNSST